MLPGLRDKHYLAVGAQGQAKWAKVSKKSSTYDVTHRKPAPLDKIFFFECNLLDWPIRLSRWTAL